MPQIDLATKKATRIENQVISEPGDWFKKFFLKWAEGFSGWVHRKAPCGGYNCHGLVFATRRTGIFLDSEIEKILVEDGYRRVTRPENPMVGDIVIYRSDSTILHSAVITRLERFEGTGEMIPFCLSKLGPGGGEVFHNYSDTPYDGSTTEIWTDRRDSGVR